MQKLDNLLSSLTYNQSGPVSVDEIARHEKNLNLKFGPNYHLFLSKYGCISAGPNELYGVCGDNASVPSAIHATVSARTNPNFPRNLLVIAEDGSGRKFCVDSHDNIFVCDRNICEKSGQSFEDFVVGWLAGC